MRWDAIAIVALRNVVTPISSYCFWQLLLLPARNQLPTDLHLLDLTGLDWPERSKKSKTCVVFEREG